MTNDGGLTASLGARFERRAAAGGGAAAAVVEKSFSAEGFTGVSKLKRGQRGRRRRVGHTGA
jgi:hypothetical protein